jgi:hypothetical protein
VDGGARAPEGGPEGVDPLILEFLPFLGLSCLIILHKKRGDEPQRWALEIMGLDFNSGWHFQVFQQSRLW